MQRVQQGMQQGMGKTGADLQQFVMQISHAARVLLFQPMLLHGVQVMHYVHSLPTDEVAGSMRQAMMYPPDSATDADRVEWLQLNLYAVASRCRSRPCLANVLTCTTPTFRCRACVFLDL